MRYLAVLVLAACGGSSSHAPKHVAEVSGGEAPPAASGTARSEAPAKPVSYPAPPNSAPPTSGTWRVTLEFPRLQGSPVGIIADASGVYVAGAVLTADDVRMRRWAVAKLDPSGALVWSGVDELPRSPAPERIVLAGGALVLGGQDSTHDSSRLLLVERRDPTSGKRTWQRRFTARDATCTSPGCAGRDTFGGIAVRGSSVVYNATVDRPVEEAFGELSLAKGAPGKSYATRSDLHARDVAADDSGIYLLEANLSDAATVVKQADGKTAWKKDLESGAQRLAVGPGGVLLWGKTIEQRAADTGEPVWTSNLVGDHLDVAADATGIYATAMFDAKPAPYFGIAKLDPASGAVQWVRRTTEYQENRPSTHIAIDKDSIYLLGIEADKLYVERRRKSDGALGEVTTTARKVEQGKRK